MNPNQQRPNYQKSKHTGQNSRIRPQYNVQHINSQNITSENVNPSSLMANQQGTLIPNQQGKISLRNNNTRKFYKVNTEAGEDNEVSVLNSIQELHEKNGRGNVGVQNIQRTKVESRSVKNSWGEEEKRETLGKQQGNYPNVTPNVKKEMKKDSINNMSNPKSQLSSKMPSSISISLHTSSNIGLTEQKFRTPSNSANFKLEGLSTMTHHQSTNSQSVISGGNPSTNPNNNIRDDLKKKGLKYFENESTKSINVTGEEMEQSRKNSNSSQLYERENNSKGVSKNNKSEYRKVVWQKSGQNKGRIVGMDCKQHQSLSSTPINYSSKPSTTQPASMINSIGEQDQQSFPSHTSSQLNNSTNGILKNYSILNCNSNNNSVSFYITSNYPQEQNVIRKPPSYYLTKPSYEKQVIIQRQPGIIQRQPSIHKTHQQQHAFAQTNHSRNAAVINYRNESSKDGLSPQLLPRPKPQFVSFQPYDHQANTRSSLTVRHLEYGRSFQPEERTKSHTKNYSTAQLLQTPLDYEHHTSFLSSEFVNSHLPHCSHQTQQLNQMSQSQPLFSQDESSSEFSNNPYMLLGQNLNRSTQKTYILDSIQEKDQFSKVFVRHNNVNSINSPVNSKSNQQKNQLSAQNTKYLQRQKNQPRFNQKQHKIHLMSQNTIIKSYDQKYSYDHKYSSNQSNSNQLLNTNQNHNTPPSFINLKYIKSPTNNSEEKLQLINNQKQQYEKYLKMGGFEPLTMENNHDKINELIGRQRQKSSQNSHHEDSKHQTHSINSSFKENSRSQTNTVYNQTNAVYNQTNAVENHAKIHHKQKPSSNIQYISHKNHEPSMKSKHQKNYPIEIYSSNKNFHHQALNKNQTNLKQQDLFRKTIDTALKGQTFDVANRYRRDEGKQVQSLGVYDVRPQIRYDSQHGEDKSHVIRINQPGVRLKSPDLHLNYQPKQLTKPTLNNLHITSPEYSPNKQTVFSPTQKSLQPAQKSHFLPLPQSQQNRQNARQKKSIKKMLVSQSKGIHQKPEVFYNYNFKDLLKGQNHESRPNSRTILEAITKNQLTRIFCSTFKIGENENGCDCIPKCYWVDMWLEKMHKHPLVERESLMRNLNKNAVGLNFNTQNVWKNFGNQEAISFHDGNYGGTNSKLSREEIETFKQIDKDIPRTCSDHPTFKSERYRDFLRQLLIHFYYLDPHLGYVQGMNLIAASITYHSKTVLQALQIMDFVMNVLNYKKIFLNDMQKCKELAAKTCQLIRHYCYDMYHFVTVENEVDLEMFILGWYFSMLGTFVPLQAMHFVISKFVDQQFEGIVKIIVTFFIFIKETLMQKTDPNQIMQELSVQSMIERSRKIDWNELISVSDKLHISLEKDKQ